jgi:hypothetical protein
VVAPMESAGPQGSSSGLIDNRPVTATAFS